MDKIDTINQGFSTMLPGGGPAEAFFGEGWGFRCKIFGREAPKNGAENAVLQNFGDFSKKIVKGKCNKNEKSKNFGGQICFSKMTLLIMKIL